MIKLIKTILIIIVFAGLYFMNISFANQHEYIPNFINILANVIEKDSSLTKETALNYAKWITDAANKHLVDPILILSVIKVESNFDPKAISLGNYGLMQVSHYWHKEKGSKKDLLNPQTNIMIGTSIMKEYYVKSKNNFKMLVRYNASDNKLIYAQKVLNNKKHFDKLIQKEIHQ